jgi:hypothetical protein
MSFPDIAERRPGNPEPQASVCIDLDCRVKPGNDEIEIVRRAVEQLASITIKPPRL